MTLDTDVLILGGGCAGLSLAVALAQHAPRLRVVTVEQRAGYTRDRTWCFWNTTQHPFSAGVTHRWHAWRVQANGAEVRQQSRHLCYEHLPADRFYDMAMKMLADARQELLLSTGAGAVRAVIGGMETETGKGTIRSRWVFDARTPSTEAMQPTLLQRFAGWHVRTDEPCFTPACVDLMDFQPSTVEGRTVFFYVLPFSEHEALVEITYLDAPHLAPEHGTRRLQERMDRLCPTGGYEILYSEAGTLPMGFQSDVTQAKAGAIPIGTRGGRIKASSGYAFQRIQKQSSAIAKALAKGAPIARRLEPRYYDWLDCVFLAALRRHPQSAAGYFLQLFRRVKPDALIPFLTETATTRDLLTVMMALPKGDFFRAAVSTAKEAVA